MISRSGSSERTLSDEQVGAVAAAHDEARRRVRPIRRVTLAHPGMTLDDAYACQQAWVDLQIAAGARIIGHKVGLTSRAMQQAMHIDEPDFGALLDDMVIHEGATVSATDYLDPKLEVELAFVLGERLAGEDIDVSDVLAATERIVPAFELNDARSHRVDPDDGATRTVRDTIADNAADAGVLLGAASIDPDRHDLRRVGAILRRNGIVEETGLAAGVLDDPARGVAWLARRLAGYDVTLEAGQVILAGSFTRPVDCRPGDHFEADFGEHGVLQLRFS